MPCTGTTAAAQRRVPSGEPGCLYSGMSRDAAELRWTGRLRGRDGGQTVGLVVALLIELPSANLIKLLMPAPKKKTKKP